MHGSRRRYYDAIDDDNDLDVFQPHERGKYMGIFGLVIGLAPAIGPTLSGYLVEYFNWRSLFHVVAPIAAVTF